MHLATNFPAREIYDTIEKVKLLEELHTSASDKVSAQDRVHFAG